MGGRSYGSASQAFRVQERHQRKVLGNDYCQKLSLIDGELVRCMEPTKGHTYCPECSRALITLTDRPEPLKNLPDNYDWSKENWKRRA